MQGATAENVHSVHTEWLNKIDFIWKMLEGRYQNTLCRDYEDRIKSNKKSIQNMMESNLFELEVGTFNQKQLVKSMKQQTKTKKFRSNVWKKVNEVEERLRIAVAHRDELSQWGIGNLVI